MNVMHASALRPHSMKSPEEGEVSWGQRYKDARRRLDKVEQDISKLKAELSQAWDARKDERWKHLIGDRSMLQQRMVYLQEERILMLKRENCGFARGEESDAKRGDDGDRYGT